MKLDSVNSTSFQARLDVTKVKTNKVRWVNIAKTFNKDTKNIPGLMQVVEHEKDIMITTNPIHDLPGDITALTYSQTMEALLAKYDDNAVVKKLIKLFNIGEVAESRKEKALEKFYQKGIYESQFQEKTLEMEYDSINEVARNKANKDAFLRNFEIVL